MLLELENNYLHEEDPATLVNLTSAYTALGRYDAAAELRDRAISITENLRGPEHPEIIHFQSLIVPQLEYILDDPHSPDIGPQRQNKINHEYQMPKFSRLDERHQPGSDSALMVSNIWDLRISKIECIPLSTSFSGTIMTVFYI